MPRSIRVPAIPHYLALMRQQLGLTQAQLAGALGLSRQFITQVEAGQRVLPGVAGLGIGWLGEGMRLATLVEPPALPTDPAPLQARAAAIAYEILQLTRRLARGRARADRATAWLRAAPALLAALPPQARRQQLWLAATSTEAEAALEGEGSPALHRLLAARLAGLQAEAAALATDLVSE